MEPNMESKYKKTEIGLIPEDWEVNILSEYVEIIGGGTPKTTNDEYWNGEIPWISVGDFVGDQRWIYETEKHITRKGLEHSSTKLLHKGQLIISARGTVGELGQVTKDMAFNQSCYGINGKVGLDNDFLYYLLRHRVKEFQQKGHGAVFNTITRETFNQILIPIPPMPEQREIARILSDLDLKISLNRKTNKTLEAIGAAVFRRWFVDFAFPDEEGKPYKLSGGKMIYNDELKREIPRGWTVKPIDEIADFLNGLALQKFPVKEDEDFLPVIKIRELRQGITESTDRANLKVPKEYIVTDGDVLFSWSGSLEVVLWGFGKGALNQHLFKVTSSEYPKWFFYYWILEYLPEYRHIASGKATTMGHIRRHHLTNSLVIVPDEKTLKRMNNIFTPIIEKIIANKIEERTLIQIRDSLLPKLMSGKIRVPVTEEHMEVS